MNFLTKKAAGIILILVYLVISLVIVGDYGLSGDEPQERGSSLVAYKYIMKDTLKNSDILSVQNKMKSVPDLHAWGYDKYYGVALHLPLVAIEHFNNFQMTDQNVFVMRHIFNVINYIFAGFCFYLILRKRYKESVIPFLGLLMYILYPRFFGEAFYNNKDILFYSWYVISVFFALRCIEFPKIKNIILFAVIAAFCTNTRILGISIVLLTIVYLITRSIYKKEKLKSTLCDILILLGTFLLTYIIIFPVTWHSPIKEIINTFNTFLHFSPWEGYNLYLGEMITKKVPWHYIPVWMFISSPLLYVVLFFAGCFTIVLNFIKKKYQSLNSNKLIYDSFFMLLFFCSLFGFIFLKIYMYTGWRHASFIFCPFLYIAIYGIYRITKLCEKKGKLVQRLFYGIFGIYMLLLGLWIIKNHPYQYVYFNYFVRPSAEKNFDIDYLHVSDNDAYKYILKIDPRPIITISYSHLDFLDIQSQNRFRVTFSEFLPEYIVSSEKSIDRYEEIYSISVDNYKICRVYKLRNNVLTKDIPIENLNIGRLGGVSQYRDKKNPEIQHYVSNGTPAYILFGPTSFQVAGMILRTGKHTIEFKVKLYSNSNNVLANVEIINERNQLIKQQNIYANNADRDGNIVTKIVVDMKSDDIVYIRAATTENSMIEVISVILKN